MPALLALARCYVFVPHSGDDIGVLAQLMVPSDCKNKDISVRGFKVELCCPSSDSIQAVQDYSPGCVGVFFNKIDSQLISGADT